MSQDHYKVLGLAKSATNDEVKKAFRQLAKQYHPDKNNAANAEEKFKEIGAAYEVLKDPDKRRVYDMQRDGERERAQMKKQNTSSNQFTSQQSTGKAGGKSGGPYTSGFSSFNTDSDSTFEPRSSGNFYSTFSSFHEDFFKRARRDFENLGRENTFKKQTRKESSEEIPKGKRKRNSKPTDKQRASFNFPRPDWNDNWHEEEDSHDTSQSSFFGKDHRYSDFMDDPFSEFDDMFDNLFSDQDPLFAFPKDFDAAFGGIFTPKHHFKGQQEKPSFGTRKSTPRFDTNYDKTKSTGFAGMSGHRQSAPSSDPNKPEEDMYDWSKPLFRNKKTSEESDYDNLDDRDAYGRLLLPCRYCGQKFITSFLANHQKLCQSVHDSDEEEDYFGFRKPNENKWGGANTSSGRQSPDPHTQTNEDYVECLWCHRRFSEAAARRHTAFCTERTAKYGTPLNPKSTSYSTSHHGRSSSVPKTGPYPTKQNMKKPAANSSRSENKAEAGSGNTRNGSQSEPSTPRGARSGSQSEPSTPRSARRFERTSNTPRKPENTGNTSHSGRQDSVNRPQTGTSNRPPTPPTSGIYGTPRSSRATGAHGTGRFGRTYLDEPFPFTSSGLHARPPRPTSSRSKARASFKQQAPRHVAESDKHVHFDIPRNP